MHADGSKSGGRKKGTPNKATAKIKETSQRTNLSRKLCYKAEREPLMPHMKDFLI